MVVFAAILLVMSMTNRIYAEEGGTITIEGGNSSETYTAYKLFDASIGTAASANQDPPVSYTIEKTIFSYRK